MTHSCYIQKRMCRKVRVALGVIILRPPGSAVQIKNTGPLQGHCAESRGPSWWPFVTTPKMPSGQ
ncbi:hypothetical protein SCLCIDRAFT_1223932 [Scleroderma citrinum Foug A]|uniref:Uncharacterized protein n=1 Tax=Scleroderma citrinum Foug A TaxID=1036808 RepID=A0A0C3CUM9_9AGAM|nr:hypothetical protein SCLCIDRAFT_1223932 [Scleroderma citrinum Foug A]